jgi:hypothetical protein
MAIANNESAQSHFNGFTTFTSFTQMLLIYRGLSCMTARSDIKACNKKAGKIARF